MANGQKAYFGLGRVVSIVLAIFGITNIVCGILTRFSRGNILGGILNLLPILWPIFWIIDLVCIIAKEDLTVLA